MKSCIGQRLPAERCPAEMLSVGNSPYFSLLLGIVCREGFAEDRLFRQSVSSKRPFLRQSEKGPLFPAVLGDSHSGMSGTGPQ